MRAFFHPAEFRHDPKLRFARGALRPAQEVPERLSRFVHAARDLGFTLLEPEDRGRAFIEAVHTPEYVRFLETAYARWKEMPADWGEEVMSSVFVREPNARRGILAEAAYHIADGASPIGAGSWEAIYASAQSAIAAAHAILAGDFHAYAICRPPGHHARVDAAGGFCYLNNAAIAAQILSQTYPRVLILDTDLHHGQGTQEIFYARDDVYYLSIHADPTNFYPAVAGFAEETGSGRGKGYNLNLPMPHHSPETVFFDRLAKALTVIHAYQPDALVLSLGFDVYEKDPQALVAVTSGGFQRLGATLASLKKPVLVVQEGGYCLEGLEENARRFFTGLLS
ncbi:MAG: histone deacetylase family protein [Zoogloeaceae bacterium]|jgi:acetoin utilization deacetylase AcuC-like enzyme|nr:histone deacetylase family protein [Zoogloeaceae bacterium]